MLVQTGKGTLSIGTQCKSEPVAQIERIGSRRAVIAELYAGRLRQVESMLAIGLIAEIAAGENNAPMPARRIIEERGVVQSHRRLRENLAAGHGEVGLRAIACAGGKDEVAEIAETLIVAQ